MTKYFKHFETALLVLCGSGLSILVFLGSFFPSARVGAQSEITISLPFISRNYETYEGGFGNVTGEVRDAQDNSPLDGAFICSKVPCSGSDPFTFSDSNGKYILSGVASGVGLMSASLDGYVTVQQTVLVKPDGEVTVNFALSKEITEEGVLRIVLTWNEDPADLDAMLWTPVSEYPKVWYVDRGNCSGVPYACLDTDDKTGYGPETITLSQIQPGKYAFGVHNPNYTIFPNITPLTQSGAQVRVYDSTGVTNEFPVPAVGQGDLWYVFDLNGDTGEITPVNCITEYGDGDAPQCNP